MGAKDSKPTFISYEDAAKRVSDNELRRIREAFKRCAGVNGTALSLDAFVHEVLCDGVPYEVAEWLYQGCGGTKRGIGFKDLLCGIVVLTKGNIEEKIKFLWTLYTNNQGDNGTYIYKRDFARTLHLENTSLPITGAQRSAEILLGLFGPGDKVTFDQFRSWLLIHKDATVLSKWLLSDIIVTHDLETPTFYQSLAGVTHLEEKDIIDLEKCFWSLRHSAPTGELDIESLTPLLSPPLPPAAVTGTFLAFDENRDGHVDFKELCCGLSAACRGPRTERLKFCFKIFDLDSDGLLNKKELIDMVEILCTVADEHAKSQGSRASTPDEEEAERGFEPEAVLLNLREKLVVAPKGKKPVFQLGSGEEMIVLTETENEGVIANDTVLTLEDFLIWSVESADGLVSPFLALLFETCHIVLGLRPQCKHHERNIVLGWLQRWQWRGYRVGQFWYLVAGTWWRAWSAYTRHAEPCARAPCAVPRPRPLDDALVCDESFTTDSTESMGSLVWRCETGSLGSGSAGSSSGVGSAPRDPGAGVSTVPPRPGPIDNSALRETNNTQVRSLTGEGGHVRRDIPLVQHRDFELVPDALWRALALWYSAPDPLPRQVIRPPNSDVELELYPLQLMLYRHVPSTQRASRMSAGSGVAMYSAVPLAPAPPDRQLAYCAAFSRLATVKQVLEFLCHVLGLAREDVRLWALGGAGAGAGAEAGAGAGARAGAGAGAEAGAGAGARAGAGAVLLDDERPSLQQLQLRERSRLLLELRNQDLTWPEEIGALSSGSRATERRETLVAPNLPGATGLHNLGNTCYMNAALQSVWNTGPLTRYFNSGMHLYEVNPSNPLGTRGTLALRYGELCKEVWSMRLVSVAPLRVAACVGRWARALGGGGQHDAQELLAWLLDALHEDLNRAPPPALRPRPPAPPAPPADSAGRADTAVAAEAWAQHQARNDSILTDLFCGQLKSRVKCHACATESVRFDAFNMLSLPLPMDSYVRAQLRVILLDGSVPVKYGVRVNSEGTYSELKRNLSQLCGLPPDSMIIVELSGAMIGRVFEETAKISAASCKELYAYEIPRDSPAAVTSDADELTNGWSASGGAHAADAADAGSRAEVSVGASTASLCMPALFCFKRSESELLMSQSPPNTFLRSHGGYTDHNDYRSSTLPKDSKKDITNSPTLSVRSLNLKPSSPRLGRVKFSSSPSNMCNMDQRPEAKVQYLIAVHRKQCRADAYFLASQRSRCVLFGVPLVVALRPGMSGRDLHAAVWTQLSRLLSPRPPPADCSNHATDCDDSLGYEFPFTLRLVSRGGAWCGRCAWHYSCRGCALPTGTEPILTPPGESPTSSKPNSTAPSLIDDELPNANSPIAKAKLQRQASARTKQNDDGWERDDSGPGTLRRLELRWLGGATRHGAARSCMLAIEWDPTALHLRYQLTRERHATDHHSVKHEAVEAAKAIDLQSCLRAFTSPEQLEQRYHCGACKQQQPATKTLQLWRAPPILIIHLKRFQFVNNKWIKSQKVVNFPFQEFDPTEYLASVPRETILRHRELSLSLSLAGQRSRASLPVDDAIAETDADDETQDDAKETKNKAKAEGRRRSSVCVTRRERLESTSLKTTPVTDDNLEDHHQHRLLEGEDPLELRYRLYAVVCHSGQLSGGHYVAYARNPSGAWLCYNDSSCRELATRAESAIDPAAAYLLFYERQGLDYEQYLPDISGREPVVQDSGSLEQDESDLKKMCVIA